MILLYNSSLLSATTQHNYSKEDKDYDAKRLIYLAVDILWTNNITWLLVELFSIFIRELYQYISIRVKTIYTFNVIF